MAVKPQDCSRFATEAQARCADHNKALEDCKTRYTADQSAVAACITRHDGEVASREQLANAVKLKNCSQVVRTMTAKCENHNKAIGDCTAKHPTDQRMAVSCIAQFDAEVSRREMQELNEQTKIRREQQAAQDSQLADCSAVPPVWKSTCEPYLKAARLCNRSTTEDKAGCMNRLNPVRENSLQDCRLMSDQTRCSDFNWRTKATNEAYKACNVVIQGGPDYVKCLDKLIYTIQEAPEDCSPGKINSAYMAECRATNKAREACAGRWNARSEYNKCIGEKRTGLINEFSKSGIKVTRAIYGGNCQNKAAPRDSLASNPDVTGIIANACNGKNACSYTVDTKVLGNSALGCIKDFVVVYECNGGPERGVQIPPDASGKIAQLSCN